MLISAAILFMFGIFVLAFGASSMGTAQFVNVMTGILAMRFFLGAKRINSLSIYFFALMFVGSVVSVQYNYLFQGSEPEQLLYSANHIWCLLLSMFVFMHVWLIDPGDSTRPARGAVRSVDGKREGAAKTEIDNGRDRLIPFVLIGILVALSPMILGFFYITDRYLYFMRPDFGLVDRVSSTYGLGYLTIFISISCAVSSLLIAELIKATRYRAALVVFVYILYVSSSSFSRGPIIGVILGAWLLLPSYKIASTRAVLVMAVASAVLLALLISGLFRNSDLSWMENFSGSLSLVMYGVSSSFDVVPSLAKAMGHYSVASYDGLYVHASQVYGLVPRSIWPEKPWYYGNLLLQEHLYPEVFLGEFGGTYLALGFPAILFSICGVTGVLIFSAILFYLIIIVDRKWKGEHSGVVAMIVSCVLANNVLFIYREGAYAFVWSTVAFLLIFLLYGLFFRLLSYGPRQ